MWKYCVISFRDNLAACKISKKKSEQIHRKGTKPHRNECSDIFKIWARMNVFRKVFGIFLKLFSTHPPSPPPKCNDSQGEKLKNLREGFLLTLNFFFFISTVSCKNIREALMKFAYLERRKNEKDPKKRSRQDLIFRSSHRRCSVKNVVLKNFASCTGKHLHWSECLFNKVASLKVSNFVKKGLQHRCFPVKLAKTP